MINMIDGLQTMLTFIGSVKNFPKKSNKGDVVYYHNSVYIYCDNEWIELGCSDNSHNSFNKIKRNKCKYCGGDLPVQKTTDYGLCKCNWCRQDNYVW